MWNKARAAFSCLTDGFRGRPLLHLLLALAAGILLAQWLPALRAASPALLVAALLTAVACCCRSRFRRLPPFLLLMAATGVFVCAGQNAAVDAFPARDGDWVEVEGTMRGAALDEGDGFRLRLQVSRVDGAAIACADIYVYGTGAPPPADSRLSLTGEVFLPAAYGNASSFDYAAYLRRQGVASAVSCYYDGSIRVLAPGGDYLPARFSAWLRASLDQAASGLSGEQRALVYGVFLGEKSGLDYQTRESMSLSGLMHLFAVSGLHVGFIVTLALLLAGRGFKRRGLRFALTLAFLLVYVGLTGGAASVLRATLMALCLLGAELLLEEQDGVSTLALAALLCLLYRPLWLFDAGFQLSFTAVFGLILYQPLFYRWLAFLPYWLRQGYAAGCAASLFTLPLLAYYFYHISWLGWLLSPLAVLAAALAVMLCFCALPLALLFPALAAIPITAAAYILQLLAVSADALVRLPLAASTVGASPGWLVACCYLLLLLLPPYAERLKRRLPLAIAALLLMFALLPPALRDYRDWHGQLAGAMVAVSYLDVGQGDATLIRFKSGETILIDGGGRPMAPGSVGQYVLLPELKSRGVTKIDIMISSHPDSDHSDGLLTVLETLPVGSFLYADCYADNAIQQALLTAAAENGAQLTPLRAGQILRVGGKPLLRVYHPPASFQAEAGEENDASLVLLLSCGEIDFLFPGDVAGGVLADLAFAGLSAEIVKLPHHGSGSGYDEVFYRYVDAQAVIVSAGRDNSYGHPAAKVVEYWQDRAAVYRTDRQGAITVVSDGRAWAARTEWE